MQAHELSQYFRMPEMVDFRQYVRTLPTNTLMGFGAFAALTTFWYATRPRAQKPPCDLAMQSVQVAGSDGARRSVLLDSDEPLVYFYDDVRTLYEGFQRGIQLSNNGPCLGSRKPDQPYEWLSYKQVAEMSECVGSALLHKGFKAAPDQFIGIFSQNRPEWVIIEQGCFTYSMVSVPLYDTLGTEAITYIINKAELSLVFVDKPGKANLLLEGVENKLTPSLKTIVLMDSYGSNLSERGRKCGVEIISMKAMEDLGRANRRKPKPPAPEDVAIICFTSGTTGSPKGALITHQNVVSDCSAFIKMTEGAFVASSDDTLISFLPLAHMFEKVVECLMLCHGAKIGFFQGDIRLLMDDLKTLQPTVFPVVPRLLNRMFDRIFAQANTTLKRWLLDFAFKRKEAELRSGIIRNNSLWDKLIFHKIQSSLGGKVRLMITGAAPVSATVLTFLRAALGCQNGTLKIIDRKKHIFKLAQGEYIAPEKIENIYQRSEPVAQVFVHGESLQAFLIAIVVPDIETLGPWAWKRGFEGSFEELCRNKGVQKAVLEDMVRLGKDSGLKPFEQVKGISLHPELFSVDNGLLTPTMKAKRPEIRNYFRSQIDELYSSIKI
ncbi:long-chain-fatty-acid--CoA ligase 1 isoform X6 [Kogia breviceps]|uniref:long-chain-fatty-acid--CoA ligase 1 isoform X6 n=1 Tax=Kogia breviceps TaxID=27615 RepID=UPI0034D2ABA9